MTPARRVGVAVGLLVALIAAGVVDRLVRPSAGGGTTVSAAQLMPAAASPAALASSWSCPLATSVGSGGAVEGHVVVANAGESSISGTVTIVPADGEAANKAISVSPRSSVSINDADLVHLPADHPWAGALVDLNGGQAAVEQVLSGAWGVTVVPCSPAASDHWYFATGSTAVDATLAIGLLNPFPSDAVVDLAFVTDQGPANPAEFEGVVVPARGLRVLNIGDHVRRRDAIATVVTARTGRVAAQKVQYRTAAGTAGLAATLGAPSLGTHWTFPDGYSADHDIEHYTVFNPSGTEARVSLAVDLDSGSAEPFDLTVPPQETLTVQVEKESRIPPQVGHSAVVTSTNGVPVVAERTVASSSPAPRTGLGDLLGARVAANRWLLPVGSVSATNDEWVIVANPGPANATVSVTGLEDGQVLAIEGLQGVAVPSGSRVAFRLGDHVQRDSLPVVVAATSPVVVERDFYFGSPPGLALAAGMPLP